MGRNRLENGFEVACLEARAADQATIDLRLRHQGGGVLWLHASPVEQSRVREAFERTGAAAVIDEYSLRAEH